MAPPMRFTQGHKHRAVNPAGERAQAITPDKYRLWITRQDRAPDQTARTERLRSLALRSLSSRADAEAEFLALPTYGKAAATAGIPMFPY